MQMMYETIYKALVEVGLEDAFSPQDYLNFFCLGNREAVDRGSHSGPSAPANTPQVLLPNPCYLCAELNQSAIYYPVTEKRPSHTIMLRISKT